MSGTPLVAYLIKKRRAGSDLNLLTPNQAEGLSNAKSRKSINMPSVAGNLFTPDNRHKTVFIIGRLAPQDISSSYLIEGMVDFLLDTMDYDILKRTVNFYFIPQANIDGVKYGTSLTNLSGSNLFDCWKNPHKIYQAELFYLKSFMNEINKDYPISHVFNFSSEFNEYLSLYSEFIHLLLELKMKINKLRIVASFLMSCQRDIKCFSLKSSTFTKRVLILIQ